MSARAKLSPSAPSNLIAGEIEVLLADIVGIDPCNSRRDDDSDVEPLAASLREHKQLQPLLLRMAGLGSFTVLAGARRWRAFKLIGADRGAFAVRVRAKVFNGDDAQARQASLAENVERASLHPLDEAERFGELIAEHPLDELARGFGLTRGFLRQRLALSRLPARVKQAWREGRFGLASAEAFTLARDPLDAEGLLDAPDAASLLLSPLDIRRRLTTRAVSANSAAAIFVGLGPYVAEGGAVIEDLFGEEAKFADVALLKRLEKEKLGREALRLQSEEGWGVVVDDGDLRDQLEPDPLDEENAERDRLEAALDALPGEERRAALAEIDRIEARAYLRAVPKSERHRYGISVSLDSEGSLAVTRAIVLAAALSSPPDVSAGGVPPEPRPRAPAPEGSSSPSRAPAGEGVPERPDEGVRADAIDDDAAFRRDAEAAIARPGVSRRYVPDDLPLSAGARRIAEAAASRAIADLVAADPVAAISYAVAAIACAGTHRRPVRLMRGAGPRSPRGALALELASATFAEALAIGRRVPGSALQSAVDELVAAAIDLKDCDGDYIAALLADAYGRDHAFREEIAAAFDYEAFFREASRAISLSAIRDVAGEAGGRARLHLDDSALALEAAVLARARRWLPAMLANQAGA